MDFFPQVITDVIQAYLSPAKVNSILFSRDVNSHILNTYILQDDTLLVITATTATFISPNDGTILGQVPIPITVTSYLSPNKENLFLVGVTDICHYIIRGLTLQLGGKRLNYPDPPQNITIVTNLYFVQWGDGIITLWNYRKRIIEVRDLPYELEHVTNYIVDGEKLHVWDWRHIYLTNIRGKIFRTIAVGDGIMKVYLIGEDKLIVAKQKGIYSRAFYRLGTIFQYYIAVYGGGHFLTEIRTGIIQNFYSLREGQFLLTARTDLGDSWAESPVETMSRLQFDGNVLLSHQIRTYSTPQSKPKYCGEFANGNLIIQIQTRDDIISPNGEYIGPLRLSGEPDKFIPHDAFLFAICGSSITMLT